MPLFYTQLQIVMNVKTPKQTSVIQTHSAVTLRDLMFVVAKRDILEMVETAQVKCHDAVVFDRSVLDGDTFNIFFYLIC